MAGAVVNVKPGGVTSTIHLTVLDVVELFKQ